MKEERTARLANVKTRRETGFEYILTCVDVRTPFGKNLLRQLKPFSPGREEELKEELQKIDELRSLLKERSSIGKLPQLFSEIKDVTNTIERSKSAILSVVEIYEVKTLLLQMRQLVAYTTGKEGERSLPEEFILRDTCELLDRLDPRHDRLNTFYIYDEYSPELGEERQRKNRLEKEIRAIQKADRERIWKEFGVQLTPKFDLIVSKASEDMEKVSKIPLLEAAEEDYVSVTFKLKQTEETFKIAQEIENVKQDLDDIEERIRKEISEDIYAHSESLLENCRRIGRLDFVLAKAGYADEKNCVMPEISTEHKIHITDGRNLQVEDVLRSKGKAYCPVTVELDRGVTCITGANMGGKTISLKMAGQVALLAQYGFFVPAKRAEIGMSSYMQLLIGDSQSVERGLSSFGSEMEELKEILDRGRDRAFIMIDEIASGTNPVEGFAITRSLVDYLMQRGYISLITTHFESVTDGDGVVNLQVRGLSDADFGHLNSEIKYANRRERIDIISKYMDYRLRRVDRRTQIPREALNIAKMLGLSAEIIDGAKKYIED